MEHNKNIEAETLSTFKKHRPSEYFSHLKTKEAFLRHNEKVERLYRFGLCMPPEFFNQKSLIDLGSGTGENTISLANWGANCTLVELNNEALDVAKKVFLEHSGITHHQFINSSLYDLNMEDFHEKFDFAHSRGVFTHVGDKKKAFNILSDLVKPGGYVIYGERNTFGGVQEMLQRLAIYSRAGNDEDKIVKVSEKLFSNDIDRSVASAPRTRKAIIFDRWVIRQQDDPTVSEVFDFFEENSLTYVSSWPKVDFLGRGMSTYHDPNNRKYLKHGAFLVENLWMILNNGESENIKSFEGKGINDYKQLVGSFSNLLRNINSDSQINLKLLKEDVIKLSELADGAFKKPEIIKRLQVFFSEVNCFINSINGEKSLSDVRQEIDNYKILFKGLTGVRHVDYLAYKSL